MTARAQDAHEHRRARLIGLYGCPARFDAAAALRLLGLRREVHPRDVIAWAYRDQAAADGWAASNRVHYRHESLGTALVEGAGVVGVTDLRPMLTAHGCPVTDPARPDGWYPPPDTRKTAGSVAAARRTGKPPGGSNPC